MPSFWSSLAKAREKQERSMAQVISSRMAGLMALRTSGRLKARRASLLELQHTAWRDSSIPFSDHPGKSGVIGNRSGIEGAYRDLVSSLLYVHSLSVIAWRMKPSHPILATIRRKSLWK